MNTSDLTTALCVLLDVAGVGQWRPAGPAYTTAETAIVYGPLPALPDRAIGVTVYIQDDDLVTGLADRMVQVRFRGAKNAPNGADVLADAAFTALHGVAHTSGIALIARSSTAPLGADTNGRQERTDNYRVIIDNPEA